MTKIGQGLEARNSNYMHKENVHANLKSRNATILEPVRAELTLGTDSRVIPRRPATRQDIAGDGLLFASNGFRTRDDEFDRHINEYK
jgi:hypothetical protein